jgi:hypothetical protein
MVLLSLLFGLLLSPPAAEALTARTDVATAPERPSTSACEDFAKRQIGLADRLTRDSNHSRALKVLNSTAKNCDRDFVREKIYEVLGEWYGTIRGRGLGAIQEFLDVVAAQSCLSASQRSRLVGQARSDVRAFYVLEDAGTVDRGMYGREADAPVASLLEEVSGSVSLLRAPGNSNLSWLVSPIGSRFLVLEFGIATTPEESVRLESIQENVESDEQWQKLYQLEYTETYPASGSAIGTLPGGAALSGEGFEGYGEIFDGSSVPTYHCTQGESEDVVRAHNFGRSRLGYGGDEWERTSSTPALYHHSLQCAGRSMRKVVWPNVVNDEWTGGIRIGLVQS